MCMRFTLPILLAVTGYCLSANAEISANAGLSANAELNANAEPLSLQQALQHTLQRSSVLQAYPYQQRIAEANLLQAGNRPVPQLNVAVENILGSGDNRGLAGAELTLSLSQQIELGSKRQRRLDVAGWQSQLQQDDYELVRLDVLADTTGQYIQLLHLQQQRLLTEQKIGRETALLNTALERSKASNLHEADISRIKLKLLRSKIALTTLDQQLELQRYQLAARWNAEPDFSAVTGNLSTLPLLPGLAELQTRLQRSPLTNRYLTRQRLAQSRLQQAEADSKADITLSAGVKRNEAQNDTSLVLGFSMPLYSAATSKASRLTAQAEQELAATQQQLNHTELNLLLKHYLLQLNTLRSVIAAIANQLLPQAGHLLTTSTAGYQQGQIDLLSVLAADEELAQANLELLESQSRFHLILLELERLTGQPLALSGPMPLPAMENK